MITIEIEFTTRTVLGLTEAKVSKSVYNSFSAHEEDVAQWVMKAIISKNVSRPAITFIYDNDSLYGVSTSRIIMDYCDGAQLIEWDDRGTLTSQIKGVKVNKRLVKMLYWKNVNRLHDWEERVYKEEHAI